MKYGQRGVYAIVCVPTGRAYVGASKDILNRWHQHRCKLGKGIHPNGPLLNAWSSHGPDSFSWRVLELVAGDTTAAEQKWMDRFKVGKGVFNLAPTAGSNRGRVLSDDHRKKLSASLKGRKRPDETRERISAGLRILGKDKAFTFSRVQTLRGEGSPTAKLTAAKVQEIHQLKADGVSQRDIAKAFGVSEATISRVVLGQRWAIQAGDHLPAGTPVELRLIG